MNEKGKTISMFIIGLLFGLCFAVAAYFTTRPVEQPVETETEAMTEVETTEVQPVEVVIENPPTEKEIIVLYAEPGDHPLKNNEVGLHTEFKMEDWDTMPFPKGYRKDIYTDNGQTHKTEIADYAPDIDRSLLIGEMATMSDMKLLNSNIEDGMIYTQFDIKLQDGTPAQLLLINHPNTMQPVAASYTLDDYDNYVLYTFTY